MKTTLKTTMKKIMFIVLIGLSITACKKDENDGEVSVKLTDGPFPYNFTSEANIEFAKIELRNKDTGDYVVVQDNSANINVANYRNGSTVELSHSEVPNGTYDKVRVTISNAEVKLTNQHSYNANISHSHVVEVAILPELEVTDSSSDELLIDFDLSDSFRFSGMMGGIINWFNDITDITGISSFNADIRASNLSRTGSITGTITDSNGNVANAEVYISYDYTGNGSTDRVIAVTDANGHYAIIGVPEGQYHVYVETEHNSGTQNCSVSVDHESRVDIQIP